ncbi:xylan 1,4-beta-xylosidase [Natronobacillus azotifigens]|uniref:Helix-turn-helix domain-containing protein n=1 Tax=Natronobacillus azotifigens TaxID=472978 RepID=A0A9J6R7K6_9BACI|nr:helix-turn-helix domain-containing protein [Natronobacillus azotifigens]MCZ0701608.1 helix-turn-helix domain-containing protein [Natronobacillus azotifigens]
MQHNYEMIQYEEDIPIKIFIHQLGSVKKHWHKSIELLYMLEGNVDIYINDKSYKLKEEDVIVINSNELHQLHSDYAVLIAVQIELDEFNLRDNIKKMSFDCFTQTQPNKSFEKIKSLIANMIYTNSLNDESTYAYNLSLAYSLIGELMRNFKSDRQINNVKTDKHLKRLSNILNYIKEHYNENLTLSQVAEREHLSAPYLSSFFDKYIGINFTTYYDKIRIEYAVNDLISSDLSIEEIARKHGFSETRSFLRAFKKEYDMLPSVYRKSQKKTNKKHDHPSDNLVDYIEFEPKYYLDKISKYFNEERTQTNVINRGNKIKSLDLIDLAEKTIPLTHNFKNFTSVGRAKELLYKEVQEMLTELQKAINFKYIKFHGLLSDDMLVCKRNENGSLSFSFILIDKVLDFLVSLDLIPLIQLSFMPEVLASNTEKHVFASKMNTSYPNDIKEWKLLIEAFIQHIQSRYGTKVIEQWLYCVWNEPDTSANMFGIGSDEKFYQLYIETYISVKKINPNLIFGSPSLLLITTMSKEWARNFLLWTVENDCTPEFLNLHYYSDDFNNLAEEHSLSLPYKAKLSHDHQDFNKYIDSVKVLLKDLHLEHLNIYLTEWNLTVSHRNLINDTVFIGCYLAKNILSNYDKLDSFGYWSLTDFIEEFQLDNNLFHGGLGLFTYNGIKKPHFYVLEFLSWLGDQLISEGDSYFITKKNDEISMICYNYEHYSKVFADGKAFAMTQTNRYTPFTQNLALDFSIPFINIDNGHYLVKEYIINQEYGSAYDKWVEMGGIPIQTDYDIHLMKNASIPRLRQYTVDVVDNNWTCFTTLEPLEVKYIEVTKVN